MVTPTIVDRSVILENEDYGLKVSMKDVGEAAGTHPKIRQSYSRSPRPAR
jgi:hypothetical protein